MRRVRRQLKDHQAESAGYRRRAWVGFGVAALLLQVAAGSCTCRFGRVIPYTFGKQPHKAASDRRHWYDLRRKGECWRQRDGLSVEVVPEQVKDLDARCRIAAVCPERRRIADFSPEFRSSAIHPVRQAATDEAKSRVCGRAIAFRRSTWSVPHRRYIRASVSACVGYVGASIPRMRTLAHPLQRGHPHGKAASTCLRSPARRFGVEQVEMNARGARCACWSDPANPESI